ncbi:transposase [Streptomyces sp. 900116325]
MAHPRPSTLLPADVRRGTHHRSVFQQAPPRCRAHSRGGDCEANGVTPPRSYRVDDHGLASSAGDAFHYGDGPQLERVLEQVSVRRAGVGRPHTRPDRLLADKAYTSRENRRYLRRRGIQHIIAERLDQQRHRQNRGSRGRRPSCP